MSSLNEELSRLSTFSDWPSEAAAWPSVLAKHGFYYTGLDDTVRCFRCGTALRDWRPGDHPLDRHRTTNPDCELVTNRDNLNAATHFPRDTQLNLLAQQPISSLEPDDVQQIIPSINRSRPDRLSWQHLRLNSFRRQTFYDWPIEHVVSSTSLARAGFFYTGDGDKVRCAFCRKCFISWQAGETPTEEHSRESSKCEFVRQNFCVQKQSSAASVKVVSKKQQQKANEKVRNKRYI